MISTSSFIGLCLCIFYIVALLLSLGTINLMIYPSKATPMQRFGYVILAIILTPFLWIIAVALIIEYIFRKIINETDKIINETEG